MPNMCTWRHGRIQRPSPAGSVRVPSKPRSRVQCVLAERSRSASTWPLVSSRTRYIEVASAVHLAEELGELDPRGTNDDQEQGGQQEEAQREQHLDRQAAGVLLRALAALGAQHVGVGAQRLRHAGAETIALDDQRSER